MTAAYDIELVAAKCEQLSAAITAALGLVAGIVTAPLALVIWPAFLAWFMFNEAEGDGK